MKPGPSQPPPRMPSWGPSGRNDSDDDTLFVPDACKAPRPPAAPSRGQLTRSPAVSICADLSSAQRFHISQVRPPLILTPHGSQEISSFWERFAEICSPSALSQGEAKERGSSFQQANLLQMFTPTLLQLSLSMDRTGLARMFTAGSRVASSPTRIAAVKIPPGLGVGGPPKARWKSGLGG